MKVVNDATQEHVPDAGLVAQLKAYMINKIVADYDDLRGDITGFEDFTDGEINQITDDAGFRSIE